MMPREMQIRMRPLALTLALGLLLAAGAADAVVLDARRMAMGGVSAPGPGSLDRANPAYPLAAPRAVGWKRSYPLPLGLLTLFDHPEELDPDDENFDPVRLANLVVNPPLHLELRQPEPLDGDIVLDLGQEHLRVYWEDAHLFLPREPLDLGGRLERFALGYGRPLGERGRWRLQVAPYLDGLAETELDDAFYGLLAEGDSLKPNSRYALRGEAAGAAGLAFKLQLGRSFGDPAATELFVAAGPKLIAGLAMVETDLELVAQSADSLYASESLDVKQVSHARWSESAGAGLGLDLGVLLRRGPWDLGLGVRDLGTSIRFGNTRLERQSLEESDDGQESDIETVVLAEGEAHSYRLDPYWTLNAGYAEGPLLLLGELRLRPWRDTLHLGAEYRLRNWALRGGLRKAGGADWQFAVGTGRRLGGVQLDLALETHDRFIQDGRGLALGMSISL